MKLIKSFAFIIVIAFLMLVPHAITFAQPAGGGTTGSTPPGITNPIKYNDLGALLIAVAEEAAKIGFYVVVFFIIWSGFLFVSAQGNKTKLETARKTFLYTVIGGAILLGAMVFANVIKGTVQQLEARAISTHYLL